jgi:hypothetical protein
MTAPPNPPSGPVWPGYAVPGGSYTTPAVRHTSHTRTLVILVVALVVVAAVVSVVAWLLTPSPPHYKCPPDCGRPPIGPPLGPATEPPPGQHPAGQSAPPAQRPAAAPTADIPPAGAVAPGQPVQSYPQFPGAGFSVAYPESGPQPDGSTITATLGTNGVKLTWSGKGVDGQVTLLGQAAGNQTAPDIAAALVQKYYPGAQKVYEITNAMVGYQPGYGEVDDYYPQAPTSSYTRMRVVVLVAVKNDLALVATADGPYVAFIPIGANPPSSGPSEEVDHPSGTSLDVATRIGQFVNSFTWKGDATRLVR